MVVCLGSVTHLSVVVVCSHRTWLEVHYALYCLLITLSILIYGFYEEFKMIVHLYILNVEVLLPSDFQMF